MQPGGLSARQELQAGHEVRGRPRQHQAVASYQTRQVTGERRGGRQDEASAKCQQADKLQPSSSWCHSTHDVQRAQQAPVDVRRKRRQPLVPAATLGRQRGRYFRKCSLCDLVLNR
jgi:hypothetical protein